MPDSLYTSTSIFFYETHVANIVRANIASGIDVLHYVAESLIILSTSHSAIHIHGGRRECGASSREKKQQATCSCRHIPSVGSRESLTLYPPAAMKVFLNAFRKGSNVCTAEYICDNHITKPTMSDIMIQSIVCLVPYDHS